MYVSVFINFPGWVDVSSNLRFPIWFFQCAALFFFLFSFTALLFLLDSERSLHTYTHWVTNSHPVTGCHTLQKLFTIFDFILPMSLHLHFPEKKKKIVFEPPHFAFSYPIDLPFTLQNFGKVDSISCLTGALDGNKKKKTSMREYNEQKKKQKISNSGIEKKTK